MIGIPPVTTVGLIVLFLFLVKVSRIGKRAHGLPPGPATLPLRALTPRSSISFTDRYFSVGNVHMFPTEYPHYK